jgi:hypothetical protein
VPRCVVRPGAVRAGETARRVDSLVRAAMSASTSRRFASEGGMLVCTAIPGGATTVPRRTGPSPFAWRSAGTPAAAAAGDAVWSAMNQFRLRGVDIYSALGPAAPRYRRAMCAAARGTAPVPPARRARAEYDRRCASRIGAQMHASQQGAAESSRSEPPHSPVWQRVAARVGRADRRLVDTTQHGQGCRGVMTLPDRHAVAFPP